MKRKLDNCWVSDVLEALKRYQTLFGQLKTGPAYDYGEPASFDDDGTVLLLSAQMGRSRTPALIRPGQVPRTRQWLLLFFRVDDYDAALKRREALFISLQRNHISIRILVHTNSPFCVILMDKLHVRVSALNAPGQLHLTAIPLRP